MKTKLKIASFMIFLGALTATFSCADDPEVVLSGEKDILSFTVPGQTEPPTLNASNLTVVAEVECGTDLTSIAPTFTISEGATSSIASGAMADYSSQVTITVTAEDGTAAAWKVTISEACANSADILTFSLAEETGAADIDNTSYTIEVEVEYGTNLTSLTPTFTLSAGASSDPVSETTGDYSSAVTITVTAEDGTTQDWTVNVTEAAAALSDATDILTFSIPEKTGDATINDTDHTIAIEVANSTDLAKLTPEFTLSEGASSSPASGTEGDYSSEVTITVTAEDGTTTQDWIVTVTEAAAGPSSAADVLAFSVPEQTALATVDASTNSIAIEVTNGTNLTSLTPTITVSPGATSDPASGTAGDYSSAVTITVTAEDGTTVEDWTVTVTEAAAGGPASEETDILTFTVPGQEQAEYIDAENHVVLVVTASGTDLSNITPTFTLSPGATSVPVSGTAGDYIDATVIVVIAEDGVTEQPWLIKIFNGFDAAGVCDVAACADNEALANECITKFDECIATYGEGAFVPCALVAVGVCD